MPLPLSGPISFNNINVELGVSGTTQASLGQASYRTLAGVPSGQISMSNFYGKANQFNFTISSPTNNANLASLAFAAGWPGASKLVATVAPGVVLSSDSTGVSALTISGSFPGGVELINNGTIAGRGGNGGNGAGPGPAGTPGGPGLPGGNALAVSTAVSINNLGTIAGGGGGGGGGAAFAQARVGSGTGGGGGGGRSSLTNSVGGPAGGSQSTAGGAGTFSSAGGGGSGGGSTAGAFGSGGTGGGWGSGGAAGNPAPRGNTRAPGGGGGGGSAVSGNPNITWINFGTRLGGIS